MDQFKTDKAVYNADDFLLWEANGLLDLVPKFQRGSVWKIGERSYFIDTMLRGMTVPPIYLRLAQNPERTKTIKEVVDGQQRIRCVLEFVGDKYKLSKALENAPWAGRKFSGLTPDQQLQIRNFGFSSEIFKGISDKDVLEVFARLNTNGVALNKQELRNGKYFGLFKQMSRRLANLYLEFWRKQSVFSETSVARMLNVELTSELIIAGHAGMQDKKDSIEDFYEKWDETYPELASHEKRFKEIMEVISEALPIPTLASLEFKRPPLFYTLYCVVHHRMYGLPGIARHSPKRKLNGDDLASLSNAVKKLSSVISQSKDPAAVVPLKYNSFLTAIARQSDNINPRKERFETLYEEAF